MASPFRPSGVYVPLVTPFDDAGRVDLEALGSLADRVLTNGAEGVVALATTGEPTSLDDAEREAVVAACAEACARHGATLIVGAGTNDTRTTILRHEALAGSPRRQGLARRRAVLRPPVRDGHRAPFPGRGGALPGTAHRLQHPVPDGPRPGRRGPARAGRDRQHRRPQTGGRAESTPTRCACSPRRARRSPCSAATTPFSIRSR